MIRGRAAKQSGSAIRRRVRLCAGAGLFALFLAGCGSSALDSYSLSAARDGVRGRASARQMAIAEPVAGSPYDSDRIVVRTGGDAVAYLKGAQWVDRLPRHLQTLMVQSFENARLLRSVGRPSERFVADVSLNSEIRRFEIDVQSAEAVVEISAKIITEGTGRIVAARVFTARVPGSASDGKAAAAALDAAFGRVVRDLVAWAAGRG